MTGLTKDLPPSVYNADHEWQRHLTGNLRPTPVSREVSDKYDLSDAAACIAVELRYSRELTYSRNQMQFSAKPQRRYHSDLSRYPTVPNAVDELERRGLIVHDRKQPGRHNQGRQSSMLATDELIHVVQSCTAGFELMPAPPLERMILRGPDKQLMGYDNRREIDRARNRLTALEEVLTTADIQGCGVGYPVRIFNDGSFKMGGRLYMRGKSWQQLPKTDRALITIGGESVVEWDYSAIHISLIYAMECREIPAEPYDVNGFEREHVKRAVNILINAKTLRSAVGALALDQGLSFPQAARIIAAVKERHKPIAGYFHSDAGKRLQNIDSEMLEGVWSPLTREGVPCLPVHDSAIVPESHGERLREMMVDSSAKVIRKATNNRSKAVLEVV